MFIKRLVDGSGIARVPPALANAALGDHIEQASFPDAQVELGPGLGGVNPQLVVIGNHGARGQRVIIGIDHEGRPRPGLDRVRRQSAGQRPGNRAQ